MKKEFPVLPQLEYCTGCSACYNCCPVNAITMEYDSEGFLFPSIDSTVCLKCGRCERICLSTKALHKESVMHCIAVQSKDDNKRKISSSGGIFTLLAEEIIKQGGYVFGAAFDNAFAVRHIAIHQNDEIRKLRGAKYVQSDVGSTYSNVKDFLQQGEKVLFVGTPCQISGLLSFLRECNTENLLTVDFICHGVPSPGVWKEYTRPYSSKAKLEDIRFRDKKYGWNDYSLKWVYSNGIEKYENRYFNEYLRGFGSNLFLRPACYSCQFKGVERSSDITLGDCWGMEAVLSDMYDELGTSILLIHTEKGKEIWSTISNDTVWSNYPIEKVISGNASIVISAETNNDREDFFKLYKTGMLKKAMKKYCAPSVKEKIIESIRIVYHKIKR